ncbi:hypothetical protein QQF64_017288 [Cirrhinus molitorella]|uniref:Uncharacterized protein n=1 Tax=Cirrhinus molitorella TaxID=172907 RepID=A0ABR3LJV3_9TELE
MSHNPCRLQEKQGACYTLDHISKSWTVGHGQQQALKLEMQEESRGPNLQSLKEEEHERDGSRGRRGNHEGAVGLTTVRRPS